MPGRPAFSTTNGTRLEIWHGNGANQRWSLPG
jgi:hypothetical protein